MKNTTLYSEFDLAHDAPVKCDLRRMLDKKNKNRDALDASFAQ